MVPRSVLVVLVPVHCGAGPGVGAGAIVLIVVLMLVLVLVSSLARSDLAGAWCHGQFWWCWSRCTVVLVPVLVLVP